MPSNAFMEVSSLSITGESGDKDWGQQSPYGMFEIANFSFELGETSPGAEGVSATSKQTAKTTTPGAGATPSDVSQHDGKIAIQKSIDYASSDLFRRCCETREDKDKGIIAWAAIYFLEAGDISKTPYLRLEFRKLQVISFAWDLDPAEGGEAAGKVEKIGFKFDTMLIKYSQQTATGLHPRVAMGMWNFAQHNGDVTEIGDNEPPDT